MSLLLDLWSGADPPFLKHCHVGFADVPDEPQHSPKPDKEVEKVRLVPFDTAACAVGCRMVVVVVVGTEHQREQPPDIRRVTFTFRVAVGLVADHVADGVGRLHPVPTDEHGEADEVGHGREARHVPDKPRECEVDRHRHVIQEPDLRELVKVLDCGPVPGESVKERVAALGPEELEKPPVAHPAAPALKGAVEVLEVLTVLVMMAVHHRPGERSALPRHDTLETQQELKAPARFVCPMREVRVKVLDSTDVEA